MSARTIPVFASGDASTKLFVLLNARSTVRKWAIIYDELVIYKPAIVAVTETWLSEDISPYYNYKNYQMFHKCRKDGGRGGVALFFSVICTVAEIVPKVSPPTSCQVL